MTESTESGLKRVYSSAELENYDSLDKLIWDVVVQSFQRGVGYKVLKVIGVNDINNNGHNKVIQCDSYGMALSGKEYRPGDKITIEGSWLQLARVFNLMDCYYTNQQKN